MKNTTNSLPMNSGYIKGLRIVIALAALFSWCLSIWWSSEGFNISVKNYQWLGIGLGLFITASQLLFNRGSNNPTIWMYVFLYIRLAEWKRVAEHYTQI